MSKQTTVKYSELVNPTDRQKEFFKALDTHKYTLYGGAKGGGKSYILRWALIRQLIKWAMQGHKFVRAGLFCEDYPSLKDRQITKIQKEFPQWLGTLSDSSIEGMSFRLNANYGSGIIALRNLDDVSKYASSEFAMIAVDELTKNKRNVFDNFRSIMRWPGIEDTKFIGGTNPGQIGHNWVKKLFIDRQFGIDDPLENQVAFVKSLPTDNPHNAKSYLEDLKRLPEKLRKAYWEGDWNIFEGQYFSEWIPDKHVVKPFPIPATFRRFGAYDHGRARPACFQWFAIDYDGDAWCYRELYVNQEDGSPRWEAEHIAKEAYRITEQANETLEYVVADSAIFSKTGTGETIAEIFQRCGVGKETGYIKHLIPSTKDRIAGWAILHQYLYHDANTQPKLKFFENCYNSIRTIPQLIYDESKPEDLDSDGEDHAADSTRYFLQTLRSKKTSAPITLEEKAIERFNQRIGSVRNLDTVGSNRWSNI